MEEDDYELNYTYGPGYQRKFMELKENNTPVRTRVYHGEFEKDVEGSTERGIHYITSPAGLVCIVVREGTTDTYHYTYTDHLGSILTVTNSSGTIEAEQSFDAWGRNRNPDTWEYDMTGVDPNPEWLYRGYTGHEHLPEFGLINMNGRLYDPILGRMLSVDNYVEEPFSSQGFNRYSYVFNNPLKYIDPSGEMWGQYGYRQADFDLPDMINHNYRGGYNGFAFHSSNIYSGGRWRSLYNGRYERVVTPVITEYITQKQVSGREFSYTCYDKMWVTEKYWDVDFSTDMVWVDGGEILPPNNLMACIGCELMTYAGNNENIPQIEKHEPIVFSNFWDNLAYKIRNIERSYDGQDNDTGLPPTWLRITYSFFPPISIVDGGRTFLTGIDLYDRDANSALDRISGLLNVFEPFAPTKLADESWFKAIILYEQTRTIHNELSPSK